MAENTKHLLELQSPQRPWKFAKNEDFSDEDEERPQKGTIVEQRMSQNPRIQRYLIAIEYIGTRFCGSQKQLNGRTVVGVLEDAGVHAMSNVCHVDVEHISKRKPGEVLQPHEPSVVQKAVNHFLQKNEGDIMVVDVRSVPSDFHARYKAQERIYFYRLLSGPEPLSTFEKDRAWHVAEELSLQAMQEACKALVGCHDFSSFRAAGCQAKSPVRTLDEFNVLEVVPSPYFPLVIERKQNVTVSDDLAHRCSKSEASTLGSFSSDDKVRVMNSGTDLGFGKRKGHRCFVVTARARSFLYHQVRLLVGVLKAVGIGNLTLSDVERILNAKTVTAASPMAPACGLYLGHVKYDLP